MTEKIIPNKTTIETYQVIINLHCTKFINSMLDRKYDINRGIIEFLKKLLELKQYQRSEILYC